MLVYGTFPKRDREADPSVSFVTYSLTGHNLDAATIFTALQYFNILETPISFLPMILTALSDAMSAVRKLDTLHRIAGPELIYLRSNQRSLES